VRDRPPRPEGRRSQGKAFGALRHRDFALLWSGSVISNVGNWMQQIAQAWLIYDLTGSALLVGLNGLIRTLPFLGMSLYAGTVADRVDRRRLYLLAEIGMLTVCLGLAVLVATGNVHVWHIYAASVLNALVGAFEIPSQQALLPQLVPRADLMNAISLNSLVRKGSQVIGPLLMHTHHQPAEGTPRNPVRAIAEGLGYVRGSALIGVLLLMESMMSLVTGFNPMLVFFARDVFGTGAQGLGLLQSAPGVGTVLGSLILSALGDVAHKGRLIIIGGLAQGVAITLFALTPWFPLALFFLVLVGAADVMVGASRTTLLQLSTRRDMLGRVMSLQAMATRGLGPLGGFEAGALGSMIGVPHAIAAGGLLCVATVAATARMVPALLRFSAADQEEPGEQPGPRPALTGARQA
jgi:MFS family permease